jgi:hypothetical protein
LPNRIVFLFSNYEWINNCEGSIGFEAENSEEKDIFTVFYLAEVEKTQFGTRKHVLIGAL